MIKARGGLAGSKLECKSGTAYQFGPILGYIPVCTGNNLEKINNNYVNYMFFLLQSYNLNYMILVYHEITPAASTMLSMCSIYKIEQFSYLNILFDPTAHRLTPVQTRMTPEEILIELPGISHDKLPIMYENDRIARYFNWKAGDVIRSRRPYGLYYRVVVKE